MDKSRDNSSKAAGEREHTERIRRLFSGIALRYDTINRQQSLRRDISWRKFPSKKMRFFDTMRFLDVATGTADLALDVVDRHEGVSAVGIDIAEDLIEIGNRKIQDKNLAHKIELQSGNALDLHFADKSFDVAGIAFGIRNINDRLHALREMTRVVVPGGQVAVLELCYHGTGVIKPLYHVYLKSIIPFMASMVSRDPEAYIYMGQSIIDFPNPDDFCEIMKEAGLVDIKHWPLTLGVARLFIGNRQSK